MDALHFNGMDYDPKDLQFWVQFGMKDEQPTAAVGVFRYGHLDSVKFMVGALAETLRASLVDLVGDERLPTALCDREVLWDPGSMTPIGDASCSAKP